MNKTRKKYFKNSLLVFLILLSFILVARVWSLDSYFASEIDELKSLIKTPVLNVRKFSAPDTSDDMIEFLKPERIVLNSQTKRAVLHMGEDDYKRFCSETEKYIGNIEQGRTKIINVEAVSEFEYCYVLKNKSVLVDYGSEFEQLFFSDLKGAGEKYENIKRVREFIISFPENTAKKTALYIKDYDSGKIFKYTVKDNKTEIDEMLRECLAELNVSNIPYSFELNFHKRQNADGTLSSVVFDPLISVVLSQQTTNVLTPVRYSAKDSSEIIDEKEILKLFNINIKSVRKYIDIDGAKVFVDNNATVEISPQGYLEYTAVESGSSVKIAENIGINSGNAKIAAGRMADFVFSVSEKLPADIYGSMRIAEFKNSGRGLYEMSLDRFMGGAAVYMQDMSSGDIIHAVNLKTENGYLKYYKHYFDVYEFSETESVGESMISAADKLISAMESDDFLTIKKAAFCYVDDGGEELNGESLFWLKEKEGIYR